MLNLWMLTSRRFLSLLLFFATAHHALASSPSYHQSVSVDKDGKPLLQFTNDSELPIVALVMVEFPSLGMEGRTYSDVYTGPRDKIIPPGASITLGLSSFRGSETKVRAEVRAVIFKDGSSAGDPVWVNAILARRLHLYDRYLSLHDLLNPLVGTGISREEVLEKLRAARADAEKQLPNDDLLVMDITAFYGAISTIDKNREAPLDAVLKVYLKDTEKRTLALEYSRPDLDTVRTLPVTTPKPLSDADIPADFRTARAALSRSAVANPAALSSCTAPSPFPDSPIPQGSQCPDSDGNGKQGYYDINYVFSGSFEMYVASTGKRTPKSWSSQTSEPPFPAKGVCWQYTDCDASNEVYYVPGKAIGEGDASSTLLPGSPALTVTQGQNAQPFYWMLDNYAQPTLADCDACDPYPAGHENPNSTNTPISSTVWSFDYACTITP